MNRQLWVVAILVAVVVVVVVLMGLDVLGCGPGPDGDVMQMALCVWMTARADGGSPSVLGELEWVIYLPKALQSRCLDWPCPGPAPVEPSPEE